MTDEIQTPSTTPPPVGEPSDKPEPVLNPDVAASQQEIQNHLTKVMNHPSLESKFMKDIADISIKVDKVFAEIKIYLESKL